MFNQTRGKTYAFQAGLCRSREILRFRIRNQLGILRYIVLSPKKSKYLVPNDLEISPSQKQVSTCFLNDSRGLSPKNSKDPKIDVCCFLSNNLSKIGSKFSKMFRIQIRNLKILRIQKWIRIRKEPLIFTAAEKYQGSVSSQPCS